ncbi:MAG: sigma-70 family RNA polymerase sigma factor [Planctomycetaceae bacterium]|nr:sigma-70 family RNA polymerase sigma factor [Planctomycetaceae bacterium]
MAIAVEPARLEQFRAFLRLKARLDLDPRLVGKFDVSGVVQQTLLEAHQGLAQFRGQGDDALLAWLQQILTRNVLDEVRRLRRVKFDAALECSLDDLTSRSYTALALDQSSPSTCAARNEQLLQLAEAINDLPPDQQTAVVMHHLQGVPLAEVANYMDRSKPAVAGLLHRGMLRLRDRLMTPTNGHRPSPLGVGKSLSVQDLTQSRNEAHRSEDGIALPSAVRRPAGQANER